MNFRLLVLIAIYLVTSLAHHTAHAAVFDKDSVLHLEIDMDSSEYVPLLKKLPSKQGDEPSIAEALRLGQRLSNWIQTENERRPADHQLRLTSAATRSGVPIDAPSQYNPAIVQTRLDALMAELPDSIKEILNTRLPYPDQLPVADDTFITLGRKLDRIYQTAARWKMLKPYMSYYTSYRARDVRGYYFLKKNGWTADRLNGFETLDAATQKQLQSWLVQLCINSDPLESYCNNSLQDAIKQKTVGKYFARYLPDAEKNWNKFFNIPTMGRRDDITWKSSDPNTAMIPFVTPSNDRITSYLRDNIEDEWKWKGWNLRLSFGHFSNAPHVVFETGVVPHVNEIGGDEITMDENQSVEEYESQWTIRHEFGHVLGFPDCYHEFYDTATESFINYQLDITDLMCSRAGNMNQRLYDELKRVYFRQ